MMTGTPVITTDWGAFTETVEQGVTGWRCRTLGEFAWAVRYAGTLDRNEIRSNAYNLYSTDEVRHDYDRYFTRLATLSGAGWYDEKEMQP
jgi:glycosyltransferase involved in cell wall biosynthesis